VILDLDLDLKLENLEQKWDGNRSGKFGAESLLIMVVVE
jgi:hypothetical protein